MQSPPQVAIWSVTLAVAVGVGLVFTWIGRELARRIGLIDAPDGRRKTQRTPIPVAGGAAVLLAALTAILVVALAFPAVASALAVDARRSIALLIATVMITTVGLVDDRFGTRARYKLLGQVAAAVVLIEPGGFVIRELGLLGSSIHLGNLATAFTLLWLLACMNALNLIDGMDGLLGTVAFIALLSLAVIAGMAGQLFAVVVALALSGAVLGFLRFNLPPASVYMGDAGSMLIGLVIGALAIPASLKGPVTVALGAPVAILILPMMDTTAAVIRRKLTGRGLATTDRGHLHHVLQKQGLTARRVLVLVAVLGLVASAGALATTALHNDLYAIIAAGGVVVTLVTTGLFGYAEFRLIMSRARATVRSLWPRGSSWELAVRLQGTADWAEVWEDVTGCAGPLNLQTVCLDVNAPALQEDYHARWDRAAGGVPETHLWRLEVPLFGQGQPIGRLTVVGGRDDEPIMDKMLTLSKIIETAEVRVVAITATTATMPATLPPQPVRA